MSFWSMVAVWGDRIDESSIKTHGFPSTAGERLSVLAEHQGHKWLELKESLGPLICHLSD